MARPKARAVVCEGRRRPRVQMRLVWKLSVPECSSHTPKPGKVPNQGKPNPTHGRTTPQLPLTRTLVDRNDRSVCTSPTVRAAEPSWNPLREQRRGWGGSHDIIHHENILENCRQR